MDIIIIPVMKLNIKKFYKVSWQATFNDYNKSNELLGEKLISLINIFFCYKVTPNATLFKETTLKSFTNSLKNYRTKHYLYYILSQS